MLLKSSALIILVMIVCINFSSAQKNQRIEREKLNKISGSGFKRTAILSNWAACSYQKAYACEDQEVKLSCDIGVPIKIIKANYGRTDSAVCNGKPNCGKESLFKNTDCISNQVSNLAKLCDGIESCTIKVSSAQLGNPCKDTYKYLDIDYSCGCEDTGSFNYQTFTQTYYAYLCPKSAKTINCPGNLKISPTSAIYGRSSSLMCVGGDSCEKPELISKSCSENLISSDLLSHFKNSCDKLNVCKLESFDGFLNVYCPGTYRYQEFQYYCE